MKKTLLTLSATFALAIGFAAPTALACDDEGHGKAAGEKATHASKVEKVALEGTIISFGCPMEAAKQQCTGAALVVGETKHLIKRADKGGELVSKTKDSNKVVKVSGTKAGEFLTVSSYSIKS